VKREGKCDFLGFHLWGAVWVGSRQRNADKAQSMAAAHGDRGRQLVLYLAGWLSGSRSSGGSSIRGTLVREVTCPRSSNPTDAGEPLGCLFCTSLKANGIFQPATFVLASTSYLVMTWPSDEQR